MSEQPTTPNDAISEEIAMVLHGLERSAQTAREANPEFQIMLASSSVNGVIRRLSDRYRTAVLDASDVLKTRFGMTITHPLYDYLFEVGLRFKQAEEAFNTETHVGCVDRAAELVTSELISASGIPATARTSGRARRAATLSGVTEEAAAAVLRAAGEYDTSKRVDRLSSDTNKVAERLEKYMPGLVDEHTRQILVQGVFWAAREVADESDGLDG